MYSLATILLIGSAAALTLKQHETVDMAQVNATYSMVDCNNHCPYSVDDDELQCDDSEVATWC